MDPEQFKNATLANEEVKEPVAEEGKEEIAEDIAGAPIQEVIDAVLDLPAKDLQHLYEAIGKVIKTKKKEAAPKTEEAPISEFNPQDMARSFM